MSKRRSGAFQVLKIVREFKKGNWWINARARKQQQQSAWDHLISFLFIPIWLGSAFALVSLAVALRNAIHPNNVGAAFQNTSTLAFSLIVFPLGIASIFIGGAASNFIVYHIPAARVVLDKEGSSFQGTDYSSMQRGLFTLGLPAIVAALVLAGVGAAIG